MIRWILLIISVFSAECARGGFRTSAPRYGGQQSPSTPHRTSYPAPAPKPPSTQYGWSQPQPSQSNPQPHSSWPAPRPTTAPSSWQLPRPTQAPNSWQISQNTGVKPTQATRDFGWQTQKPPQMTNNQNLGWQSSQNHQSLPQSVTTKPGWQLSQNHQSLPQPVTSKPNENLPQNKPSAPFYPTQAPQNHQNWPQPVTTKPGWQLPQNHQSLPQPVTSKPNGNLPQNKPNAPYPTQPPQNHQKFPQPVTTKPGWQLPQNHQNLPQPVTTKPVGNLPQNRPYPTQAPSLPHGVTPKYGWQNPQVGKNGGTTHVAYPTQKTYYPVQNNPYNTGKKYEKGYSKGYDEGYQRGVQQNSRIHPSYYPQQSQFGYPGQGINVGYGSPMYHGTPMFGTPNNYGYGVNNAYGYQTYGTGNHDLRNGLLLGALGGYLFHSLITPSHSNLLGQTRTSSNPWGYSGSGYGSNYHYSTVDKTTIINNNNYFGESPKKATSSHPEATPDHWIQCVAYDPMSGSTLTNPNCTCAVTIATDSDTNTTMANHNCTTIWGNQIEKTPVPEGESIDLLYSTDKAKNPEKLEVENDINKRRLEVYAQLDKILNMGSFVN